MIKNCVILLSGGVGARLGDPIPKQYIPVKGKPVLLYTMEAVERCPAIDAILVVCAPEYEETVKSLAAENGIRKFIGCAPAGKNRQRSADNGLFEIERRGGCENLIVHDAVRPFVNDRILSDGLEKLREYEAALAAIPTRDSCYKSADGKVMEGPLDRSVIYRGQTPEFFRYESYLRAVRASSDEELDRVTGSAAVAMLRGIRVALSLGEERNFKITTPEDLARFRREIGERGEDGGEE
ncbi:MAG: 2-C-methyl-D-erythritol 4-phosphate cytidylyltransferase [Clostridia bacterium]|nr:2-C-methyl-D-erythritol 4-phosphate cytidylyltransferase [Clostridia bacterium]